MQLNIGRASHALSIKTQRRILSNLRRLALSGDVAASEALLRLAMSTGQSVAANSLPAVNR
jgi:hypothetical protein